MILNSKRHNSYFIIHNSSLGQLILQILILGTVAIIVLSGFIVWLDSFVKSAVRFSDRASALVIAEAGIEYYRWHLAHDPTDYEDGTGAQGPYIHPFFDKDGIQIGQFELTITPPVIGSTVLTIRSSGTLTGSSNIEKIIEVKMGIPSLGQYAVAANADIRFGEGTEVFGPIHSNGGIRFDGLAHNVISSAKDEYNDPDHSGNKEFGVHTHLNPIDPQPPSAVPDRPDVFEAGRQFPIPAVDFAGLTADLAELKSDAQTNGLYFGDSGEKGYHVVVKTNDTFDLYEVNDLFPTPSGCTKVVGQKDWGTWSIDSGGETFLSNNPFPANGIVFLEDNVWVDGQIDTARITIAAGRFPENSSNYAHITVNNDLLYTNYDGQDSIALFSQGNFNAGLVSEDDLRIDAALIAQNKRVGRYYYRPPSGNKNRCSPYDTRQVITLYGMIATNERYGFAYTDGTGYLIRNIIFDPNLLFNPPPSFPLTSQSYETISWEEIK